ncbi:hypothetical protein SAMN05421827_11680 [Pedobacter terrae]|uniref:Uncharacterized protein n=1 Tax=Pedobacter terrae TaxID=405671 RepID=A0A1G7ZK32_9SPHI|nr:hypothetical protein SAMN05421827_11680 [Pedobacter terrae]
MKTANKINPIAYRIGMTNRAKSIDFKALFLTNNYRIQVINVKNPM